MGLDHYRLPNGQLPHRVSEGFEAFICSTCVRRKRHPKGRSDGGTAGAMGCGVGLRPTKGKVLATGKMLSGDIGPPLSKWLVLRVPMRERERESKSDGLPPTSDGLQPRTDGLQPNSKKWPSGNTLTTLFIIGNLPQPASNTTPLHTTCVSPLEIKCSPCCETHHFISY